MASSLSATSFSLLLTLLLCTHIQATELVFTLVNHCPFPVWPAIQPNAGFPVLEKGGFQLNTNTHRTFRAPTTHWSGRMWARTHCHHSNGHFTCLTGGCGDKVECNGAGGATPATLAQFSIHHGNNDLSSYAVSVVDGYNLPFSITPHEGKGVCPVVDCRADLIPTCPAALQHRVPAGHGPVVGCKSGCEAFNTDELCCRNHFNSPHTCKPSSYSSFFKHACPSSFTYAHDTPSLMHECSSPRELKIIFCH